ncbi:MAG: hypothetical protein ACK5PS_16535 [Desulfopila sp.]
MRSIVLTFILISLNFSAALASPLAYNYTGKSARLDDLWGWVDDGGIASIGGESTRNNFGGASQFTLAKRSYIGHTVFDLHLTNVREYDADQLASYYNLIDFTFNIYENRINQDEEKLSNMGVEAPGSSLTTTPSIHITSNDLNWNDVFVSTTLILLC